MMGYPIHTYNNGQPYSTPKGHNAPTDRIVVRRSGHPILTGRPSSEEFLSKVKRELKIRYYSSRTIKAYLSALRKFLFWVGMPPNKVTNEHVRQFLEFIADGGASASWLATVLSAIRTAFDKFCCRDITLGLATPRRPKQQPHILSRRQIQALIQAAPALQDKLVVIIMYATGMRVSEVAKLKWQDFDFDRNLIYVRRGKGNADRIVSMPNTFRQNFIQLAELANFEGYVFPARQIGRRNRRYIGRHISTRSLQRLIKTLAERAAITKRVTPHSFRHAFATHLLENGTDIRFIQKLLGHRNLDTTVIYTKVAKLNVARVTNPLDSLNDSDQGLSDQSVPPQKPVGKLTVQISNFEFESGNTTATAKLGIHKGPTGAEKIDLPLISISMKRESWIEITFPSLTHWESSLAQLTEAQQNRIKSPEFFELIRTEISSRFLRRVKESCPTSPD